MQQFQQAAVDQEVRLRGIAEHVESGRLKLASMGSAIDKLTPAQKKYLAGWQEGT